MFLESDIQWCREQFVLQVASSTQKPIDRVYWVDGTSAGLPGRRVDGVDDDGLNWFEGQYDR